MLRAIKYFLVIALVAGLDVRPATAKTLPEIYEGATEAAKVGICTSASYLVSAYLAKSIVKRGPTSETVEQYEDAVFVWAIYRDLWMGERMGTEDELLDIHGRFVTAESRLEGVDALLDIFEQCTLQARVYAKAGRVTRESAKDAADYAGRMAQSAAKGKPEHGVPEPKSGATSPSAKPPASSPVSGNGTGFLVSDKGHIVTNYHVVENADRIRVSHPSSSQSYPATVVAVDPDNDLALIKTSLVGVPLRLARQSSVQVGEEVFTLGYPLVGIQGHEQKAAFGRVAALSGIRDAREALQLDMGVQPGNSGGPVLARDGRVHGVVFGMLDQQKLLESTGVAAGNTSYAVKVEYVVKLVEPFGIVARPSTMTLAIPQVAKLASGAVVAVVVDKPASSAR